MAKPNNRTSAQAEISEIIASLRAVQSTLAVAISALRHQNADIDADIADLLQRSVSHTIDAQIERLEAVRAGLPRSARLRH